VPKKPLGTAVATSVEEYLAQAETKSRPDVGFKVDLSGTSDCGTAEECQERIGIALTSYQSQLQATRMKLIDNDGSSESSTTKGPDVPPVYCGGGHDGCSFECYVCVTGKSYDCCHDGEYEACCTLGWDCGCPS